ncbi:MAG: carbon starvation protein A [Opitutales bacterium]
MLLALLVVTLVLCGLAYRYFGRALERWTGLDRAESTPAHDRRDGIDFLPAKPGVLFGHHFSSIAGAGPIVGPIFAASLFGWGPTWLWIILGAVFVGGVHDFGATIMSLRTGGNTIVETCRRLVGKQTALLFILFTVVALIYVIIVFLDLTAGSFASRPAVATASGWFVVTALVFGMLIRAKTLSFAKLAAIFIALTYLGLGVGQWFPAPELDKTVWVWLILGYCLLAAILPVDWLMQPRDFLSATFLYAIMALGLVGLAVGGGNFELPFFIDFKAQDGSLLVPFLFITVACGACSGFHSMVASGTTSKQIDRPADVRPVTYGAMLVEAVLATLSLACLGVLGAMAEGGPVATFAQGAGVFFGALGVPAELAATFAMLAISTFLLTTLDTCTRLCRFLLEELTGWRGSLVSRLALTAGVLAISGFFAVQTYPDASGTLTPAWRAIWPLFGSTNQLLAALALTTFLVYQRSCARPFAFLIAPAGVMVLMPLLALGTMAFDSEATTLLRLMAVGLFALGACVVALSIRTFTAPARGLITGAEADG